MNFLCGSIYRGQLNIVFVFFSEDDSPDSLDMPLPAIEDREKADSC